MKNDNEIDTEETSIFDKRLNFLNPQAKSKKKKPYLIRQVKSSDLYELERMERLCWPKSRRTKTTVIKTRLEAYPECQFVLEREGAIVGVIYSQRIKDKDQLHRMRTDTSWNFHDKTGSVIQLLG